MKFKRKDSMPIKSACKYTGMSQRQIHLYVERGALKCVRTEGNHRKFLPTELDDFLLRVIRFNKAARELGLKGIRGNQ